MTNRTLVLSKNVSAIQDAYLRSSGDAHYFDFDRVSEIFFDIAMVELSEYTARLSDAQILDVARCFAITEYDIYVTPYIIDVQDK